jgi:phosphatidylserine/phosphatidylglycerophosphate/cardiolipin synthase-like enzyme
LAQNYLAEFEEMFSDDAFGPGSPANTPKAELNVNGVAMQVCFSPDDGCAARLARLIASAQHSVHFMAFSFTSDPLAEALIERAEAGVEVAGVMEASQMLSNAGTDFQRFLEAGIDVRPDGNERNMHHKVLIIDGRFVATGSYNFSHYAETRNDENSLVIDDPQIAALFEAEFQKLLAQAE